MKILYIAGPYMGPTYRHIEANIMDARLAAIELAEAGIGFFCPHLNSAHFEQWTPDVPESFWKTLDMQMLKHCDAILMLPRWDKSSGARAEKVEAERLGLPVFYTVPTSERWS